jgi:tetratricopeptide (TPR) repeat protein
MSNGAKPPLDALLSQASRLQQAGRLEDARGLYEEILRREPGQPDALHLLGVLAARSGDPARAVELIGQAVAARPANPVYHFNLGNGLKACGEPARALAAYRQAIALKADFAKACLALGNLLFELGRLEEGEAAYRRALEIDPAEPAILGRLANLLERSHRLEEARDALERGFALAPGHPLLNLAAARALKADYHFERGQLLDRAGAFGEAFAAFSEMNRQIGATQGRLGQRDAAYRRQIEAMARLVERAGADLMAGPARRTGQETPQFLVGFPRSGTTLIGQILDSHPRVQTLDETPTVEVMVEAASRLEGGYPACLERLTEPQAVRLRQAYFEVAARSAEPLPGKLLVDKLPLATVHLALIRQVFPEARILFALRHPCDVALSCFMQAVKSHYAPGAFLTLEGVARLYEEVMALWQRGGALLPPGTALVLRYEDLVAQPESKIRELIDFLEIDWDPAVLDFWRHARAHGGGAVTPSYSQVTKPIYRSATYRWKSYAGELAPIMERLRPFVASFGYGEGADEAKRG